MELKVTQEPMEDRQIALTVEVDQSYVDQELKKAARKVARQYQFPGFRKGKAPYSIVVQHAGKEALYGEFVDDLGQEVYKQVLEDEDLEPYAMASLTDVQYDPLRYILHVPLEPEIDLGDYRSLRVELEVPEVTDEDVEKRLEAYQEQYADWKEVDRESDFGDLMNIDLRSVLSEPDEDGEEVVVLDETNWEMTPDLENPTDPPGLDEALTGLKSGDEKEFTLSWPEDSQSIYAGQTANIKVKVNSIQSHENAELNDELAQMIGPDLETVADLKANVRETLEEEAKNKAEAEYVDNTFEEILKTAKLNYPPVVIEDQLDSMMNDFSGQLRRYGIEDLDGYLQSVGQTREDMRESQRESAVSSAERNLILSELIQLEGLIAEDDDIDLEIRKMLGDDVEAEDDASEDSIGDDADTADAAGDDADTIDVASDAADDAEGDDDSDTSDGSEDAAAEIGEDEIDEEEIDEEEAYRKNMFDMFRDGPGRPMVESQVLTQKATDRLLAIARGEDLPEPTPLPPKESKKDDADESADGESADDGSSSDDDVDASAEENSSADVPADAVAEA